MPIRDCGPGGPPPDVWQRQNALHPACTQITEFGSGPDVDHFSDVEVDAVDNCLTIYLTGEITEERKARYRAAATALPTGASLHFRPALLTRAQVRSLGRIWQQRHQWLADHGVRSSVAGPDRQAGGRFTVGYHPKDPPPDPCLLEPFLVYGPGTVVFVPRAVETMERPRKMAGGPDQRPQADDDA
jgi:hypothetical protein